MNVFFVLDVRYVLAHLPDFGRAAAVSLGLAAYATPAAMAAGVLLVLGRISHSRLAYNASTAYIELYRNTPLLVQLYFVFFGLPLIGLPLSPFVSGVVALAAQHAAYFSEIYRGAIQSITERQAEAGRALGFRRWQIMRLIILPQALRDAIPPIGNEIILLFLDTSLVSTVGVIELTHETNILGERSAATFAVFVFAAVVYLLMTSILSAVMRQLEHTQRIRR